MATNIYHEIRAALDNHLKTFPDIPQYGARQMIHWENTTFEKVIGQSWLQTHLLPGTPTGRSLGGNPNTTCVGVYHINVFVPSGGGPKVSDRLADGLLRHFRSGLRPAYQQTTVTLRTPSRGSGPTNTDWVQIPIIVNWRSFTTEI